MRLSNARGSDNKVNISAIRANLDDIGRQLGKRMNGSALGVNVSITGADRPPPPALPCA